MQQYSSGILVCGFLILSLSDFDMKIMLALLKEFGSYSSSSHFCKSLRIDVNSSANV
jgi:hypothetical protein